ncbi:MAG: S26 family signal peptidase [Bacilli bacterium]|nr:S26 family signal peptidase [Bacilli bacterium]
MFDENYSVDTTGEIQGDSRPTKNKKGKKPLWLRILATAGKVLLIGVFVVSIGLSAFLIYVRVAYPDPCFVNGMSMYPSLNSDGYDSNDKPLTYHSRSQGAGCSVDYGYTDNSASSIAALKRFDIAVTYWPSDAINPIDFNTPLKENIQEGKDPKIKRVIGLPGEWVKLEKIIDEERKDPNSPNGRLYVKANETDEWKYVPQPLTRDDYDNPIRRQGFDIKITSNRYPAMGTVRKGKSGNEYVWQLGKKGAPGKDGIDADEYLLMGDNRAGPENSLYSEDSRSITLSGEEFKDYDGAVPSYYITGKLIKIIGRCKIGKASKDGPAGCSLQYETLKMPWNWDVK